MDIINEEYQSILKGYKTGLTEITNYKKHLKSLLSERLPNIQFVILLRRNESEKFVFQSTVAKAMEMKSVLTDN